MDSENKNQEDFQDFADTPDELMLDSDIAELDQDAVEHALKKIVSQMSEEDSEFAGSEFQIQKEQQETSKEEVQDEIPSVNIIDKENSKSAVQDDTNIKDNEQPIESDIEENTEKTKEQTSEKEELAQWEEYNSSNDVIKKYIIYISKDFIPYIDNLSTDERSAYINDAIQIKLDMQNEHKKAVNKRNAVIHFVLAIFIIIALTPIGLIFARKAIMATFENYKYSQENFEKLYKHRFEKDKAFMESLQYNEAYRKKIKESTK